MTIENPVIIETLLAYGCFDRGIDDEISLKDAIERLNAVLASHPDAELTLEGERDWGYGEFDVDFSALLQIVRPETPAETQARELKEKTEAAERFARNQKERFERYQALKREFEGGKK